MGATSLTEAAQNIGKYNLIEKIGEGYLGPVYRGFDQDLGIPVVIRILYDGIRWDSKAEELFQKEIRFVAGLQHPNIARILDFGSNGLTRYFVMESLGNGTLENLTGQNSTVPVEKKLSIMIQISDGLGHAHKNGVLHRDLVPGKIHLTPDGNAKIRDFAIAHALMKYIPHPAVRWGAPIYLCPEQIRHEACDARSDIFSLGTIFYELITHCHPFHDRDSNRALDNILSDTPIPTFEKFPDAPPGIWTILRSCLAKSPEDRFQSADELSSACRQLLVSLAEDSQLVLSELYAALSPLRKAATQPNASPETVGLLSDIQTLLRGEKEADYAYLDLLMNKLMDQYPSIQAIAKEPPPIGSLCPQLPPEEEEVLPPADPMRLSLPEHSKEEQIRTEDESQPVISEPLQAVEKKAELPIPLKDQVEDALPEAGRTLPNTEKAQETAQVPLQEAAATPLPETESAPDEIVESVQAQPPAESPAEESKVLLMEELPPFVEELEQPQAAFQSDFRDPVPVSSYRRIPRPSYRTTVVLLSLLVIAAAGYIVMSGQAAESFQKAWNSDLLQNLNPRHWTSSAQNSQEITDAKQSRTGSSESGKDTRQQTSLNSESAGIAAMTPVEAAKARILGLLAAGKFQAAKNEIDVLQTTYPEAAEILRKQLQSLSGQKQMQDQSRRDEEQKNLLRQKEDDWSRQLSEFLAHGKYGEAIGALTLWLTENPGSTRAQELNAKVQDIQRQLKNYSSAIGDNRYTDALNSVGALERINPADPNLPEMRRQAEARKAAARANLTVYRLGAKAAILLDGKPIGKDGEIDNEPIPIGSHTISIENGGGVIASRIQEYSEGQHIVLVYDPVKQNLRTITESDREMLAQRKAMENVERFSVEHDHGIFRGSCRGVVSLNTLDMAYNPSSGSHGFRIPFKLLKLIADGKIVSLQYISDGTHFQTFRFQDSQAAFKFRQKWDELKSLLH